MSWLFPLYLLGAAAIIAPILMHLRRKPPQNRVEFSSLMFLDAQKPVPIRKRRLEHWLLLLLRCLALLLLALMFARPWLRSQADADGSKTEALIVLLDRSASMRRGDLWQRAVDGARQAVQRVAQTDRIAVAAFDHTVQPLWTFDQDRAEAPVRVASIAKQLETLKPGWGGSDLGEALAQAISWFGSASTGSGLRKRITLITDLQEGAKIERLRSIAWPDDVTVELIRVDAPNTDNFSLSLAASDVSAAGPSEADNTTPPGIRVRLANARDSKTADFTLAWEKGGTEVVKGYLPPGASRVLPAPPASVGSASGRQATILQVSGDAWDFDNRVFMAPPQPRKLRIGWLRPETNRDEASSPLYYLTRALQPTATVQPAVEVIQPAKPDAIAECQIAFFGDSNNAATIETQRRWLEAGGLGIWPLSPSISASAIEALTGIAGITTTEAAADDYRMLGEVKADHPLLRPFADSRLRDFTKLRFWHHRVLKISDDAARRLDVIARFDNGDPAMLAIVQGKGTLLILTSGWHPADSQLALSTKFVPLVYGWLGAAGFAHEAGQLLVVGDALPLDARQAASVKTPEGKVIEAKAGEVVRAEMTGIYEVNRESGQGKRELHAVNLPADEGRITPMEPGRLQELGVKFEQGALNLSPAEAQQERERVAAHEAEARQQGWWWVLVAMLGVLIWETWLAGRGARPAQTPEVQA